MHLLLQLFGGGLYLLNKIFFALMGRAKKRKQPHMVRKWRIASWAVYLAGLPFIVWFFALNQNWIAASVEACVTPSMILGLMIAVRSRGQDLDLDEEVKKRTPRWLNLLSLGFIPVGFILSYKSFGGLDTLNQWLEIGLVTGFLFGTRRLAKDHADGYLWYVLMIVTCGWLFFIQGLFWLFLQQIASLGFIVYAYWADRTASTAKSA